MAGASNSFFGSEALSVPLSSLTSTYHASNALSRSRKNARNWPSGDHSGETTEPTFVSW